MSVQQNGQQTLNSPLIKYQERMSDLLQTNFWYSLSSPLGFALSDFNIDLIVLKIQKNNGIYSCEVYIF